METEKVKEIKKALECCSNSWNCNSCNRNKEGNNRFQCSENLLKDILTLINELESENERLSKQLPQFAERVKMEFYYQFDEIIPSIMADKIDEILNECIE